MFEPFHWFLYDFILFVIDMHKNGSISLFSAPFDHFQKCMFYGLIIWHLLKCRHKRAKHRKRYTEENTFGISLYKMHNKKYELYQFVKFYIMLTCYQFCKTSWYMIYHRWINAVCEDWGVPKKKLLSRIIWPLVRNRFQRPQKFTVIDPQTTLRQRFMCLRLW